MELWGGDVHPQGQAGQAGWAGTACPCLGWEKGVGDLRGVARDQPSTVAGSAPLEARDLTVLARGAGGHSRSPQDAEPRARSLRGLCVCQTEPLRRISKMTPASVLSGFKA